MNIDNLRIGTTLKTKFSIRFINPETHRPIIFKSSEKLWITGSTTFNDSKIYKIGKRRHHLGEGYYFPYNVIKDMFELENKNAV